MKILRKVWFVLVLGLGIVGCQPSTKVISSKVQGLLQQKLDATFGNDDVKVSTVVAVHEQNNKYQGVATISAFGDSKTLKVGILADRSNVIYEASTSDWSSLVIAINQQKVEVVKGKYSNVVIENDGVFSSFPATLKRDKTKFSERLSTVVPVRLQANLWVGSGCKAHECGSEEAAWAIDRDNAKGYAVILASGVAGPTFSTYGSEPSRLPLPLLAWALEKGMNDFNSVEIRPTPEESSGK